MKLLFDQNISYRVVLRLQNTFSGAKHVKDFDLQFSSDLQIWNFAKQKGFALVTFDADFKELAALYGHPPKIVWLRFGNTPIPNLVEKIERKREIIRQFLLDIEYVNVGCLSIYD